MHARAVETALRRAGRAGCGGNEKESSAVCRGKQRVKGNVGRGRGRQSALGRKCRWNGEQAVAIQEEGSESRSFQEVKVNNRHALQ
jgi:hypothetical protein